MKKGNSIPRLLTVLIACFLLQSLLLQPVSQARRVAASANGPTPSIVNGKTNPAILTPPSLPDLVSPHGITIGGAIGGAGGHFSAWGGTITLIASDAVVVSGGKCAFNVSYDMNNLGTTPTSAPFKNSLRVGSAEVSVQSSLSMAAAATQQINTQAYLPAGISTLSLSLDSSSVVAESNEANNASKVTIKVNCAAGLPDITSQKGITIGGSLLTGVPGHFVPWGGSITLSTADAAEFFGEKNCHFNVTYDLENVGTAPTTPLFVNDLTLDGVSKATVSLQSLAAGATTKNTTSPYLVHGGHILALSLDDGHVVHESNESNNTFKIKVQVNCP